MFGQRREFDKKEKDISGSFMDIIKLLIECIKKNK